MPASGHDIPMAGVIRIPQLRLAHTNQSDRFMAADAGWIFAMAINVYLTLYRNFDTKRLRRLETTYLLACYGIPFIPAFTFLFIRRGDMRVYGDAVLWCWIDLEFEVLRLAAFYGPVW